MKKVIVIPIVAAIVLTSGGVMLASKGTDAVTVAEKQKGSILTAEQVNISFQQVGGKVQQILVQEEQRVKKGDILMVLDSTDIDLQIDKAKTEIAQLDLQIKQTDDSIQLGYKKVGTQEKQATLDIQTAEVSQKQVLDGPRSEDIHKQELAVQAARESYDNAKLTYDRAKQLFESGGAPQATLDSAQTALTLAENAIKQQEDILKKMINGATKEEKAQASLATDRAKTVTQQLDQVKEELENNKINISLLQQKKEAAQVQLKTLEVQKERLTLTAPQDGKILKVLPKVGENVAIGAPVITLETDLFYYDLFVNEKQVAHFKVDGEIKGHVIGLNQEMTGKTRFITAAPQFTNLRMSREKGTADLSSFQVRVYVQKIDSLLPGMTIEVNVDEIATR
ncbi:MAG TPA: biotin/lipoyl-binding protein [Bacillota bacterium]|nr:biotin/lipoyl-binding protein [Bacillota bacterium]